MGDDVVVIVVVEVFDYVEVGLGGVYYVVEVDFGCWVVECDVFCVFVYGV